MSPLVARRHYIHRIPPHVRDDAYAPRIEAERHYDNHKFTKYGSRIFSFQGLTRFLKISPSGKSVRRKTMTYNVFWA